MAYNLLSRRLTLYCRSGGSSPNAPDIRAWGTAYYEQTESDKQNNQSKVKLDVGIYMPTSAWVRFKLKAYIYEKINGVWTQIGSGNYDHSTGSTEPGLTYKDFITITNKTINHDVNGEGQFRVSVSINDVWIDVGTAYQNVSNQSYAFTYDLPTIEDQAAIESVTTIETNQSLINCGIANNVYVNQLSQKSYTISVDNPNSLTINSYKVQNTDAIYGTSSSNVVAINYTGKNLSTEIINNVRRPLIKAFVYFQGGYTISSYVGYNENTYIDYHIPQFVQTATTTKRNGQLSGKVTLNISGSYYNGSVGSVNQGGSYKPTIKYKFWKKEKAEPSSYSNTISSSNITISNGTFSVTNLEIGSTDTSASNYFNYNYAYNVKLQVSDNFKSTTYTCLVTTGVPVWTEYSNRLEVSRIRTNSGSFDATSTGGVHISDLVCTSASIEDFYADNIEAGLCTLGANQTQITFGKTFKNAPKVVITPYTSTSGVIAPKIIDITETGFTAMIGGTGWNNIVCVYIAIDM